jgi:GNAT superfamily N-acetyltransferase
MANIRIATLNDVDELIRMRWDYTLEEQPNAAFDEVEFHQICRNFLERALSGGDWHIWIAETEAKIVSHMYLQLIHKVPRPGKSADPYFGYVTNVYTRPAYRGRGIGTTIHTAMEQWSKENHVEFLVLWPSADSVPFYLRNGFSPSEDVLEKHW